MMYLNIAVLKETTPDERRVALSPDVATKLIERGAKVAVQTWAWNFGRLSGVAFKGILFTEDPEELLSDADIVLAIQPPALEMIDVMQEGSILISYVHPNENPAVVQKLLDRNITSFVLDRLPYTPHARGLEASSHLFNVICSMVKNNVIELDWNKAILAQSVFTHAGRVWNVPVNMLAKPKSAGKKINVKQAKVRQATQATQAGFVPSEVFQEGL